MYGPGGPGFGPLLMGGSRESDEAASRDSWPAVIAFLEEGLRVGEG
jgi:hypothetical protein